MKLKYAFVFNVCLVSSTYAVPLDFNGDGVSELFGIENQTDGSPNEKVFHIHDLSTSATDDSNEFGKRTTLEVPADYDGDGVTDLAIVQQKEGEGETALTWRIKLSSAGGSDVTEVDFGTVEDRVLSGCDRDGDGRADLTVIRKKQIISQNYDSESSTTDQIGFKPKYAACGDYDGDAESVGDELIAVRKLKNSKPKIRVIKAGSLLQQRNAKKAQGVLAIDIDGDGIKEVGYYRHKGSNNSQIIVYDANGNKQKYLVSRIEEITVGAYDESSTIDGVFIKVNSNDSFRLHRNINSEAENINISDTEGLVAVNQLQKVGQTSSNESGCDVDREAPDGGGGFLWKPVSDSNGKVVVLTPGGEFHENLRIVKDEQVLETLDYVGNSDNSDSNGLRNHFRGDLPGGSYPNNITVITTLNGQNHCWLISDPGERVD
ncbi:MAG: hypothetical protein H6619_01630 [Deltaproteobacteria bacterium]|nr:hypothetical protein [Deltaproteobacteria bacterium]